MSATAPKLSADQARQIHAAEVEAERAKRALEKAEADRDKVRARLRDRIPPSEDVEERAKGIRSCTIGGVSIRVTPVDGQDKFAVSRFVAAGGSIDVLRPGMKRGKSFDRWTVDAEDGPKHLDAVEPAR